MLYPVAYGIEPVMPAATQIRENTERALAKMIATEQAAGRASVQVKIGHPAADLIEYAKESEADLIAMASHGRTGLSHFFLGSVAEKVVRMVSCPVFTVKSFGKDLLPQPVPKAAASAAKV